MIGTTQILTTEQMRRVEFDAMASGDVSGFSLMERAGRAVADQIRLHWPKAGRVTVLCGPGNNGGDGYVIARRLSQAGWQVRVLGTDTNSGPDAQEMRQEWLLFGRIEPLTTAALSAPPPDLYVDAIFGTGLTRPVEGDLARVLGRLALGAHNRLVAVDCPSGMCMDSGVMLGWSRPDMAPKAVLTVAFDSPKPGHLLAPGAALCGKVVIADIGLAEWRKKLLRKRPRLTAIWSIFDRNETWSLPIMSVDKRHSSAAANKFGHGHAVILAGHAGKGGAARLAASAALRVGTGLVTICPPDEAMAEHAATPNALMRRPINDPEELTDLLQDERIRALCIGPGLGIARASALLPALLKSGRPSVLDADALTALAGHDAPFRDLHESCILTPHFGEFTRLFPDLAARVSSIPTEGPAYSKLDAAREAAQRCGAVLLLKGPDTVIAAPDGHAQIHSAFDVPWLATAGAGDVLAGLITGLLARGSGTMEAASLGTLLHAKAARLFGPGLIADDLPEMIPQVFREMGM